MSAFQEMLRVDAAEASDGAHPAVMLQAALAHGKVRPSDFFTSLIYQYETKGDLSDKQIACITKAISKALPARTRVAVDVSQILDLFAKAKASGIKYPKIRMSAGSVPLVLSMCGSKSKSPGAINVTDGGPFNDNLWFGQIKTNGDFVQSRSATPEVVKVLSALAANPHATAHAYGVRTSNCCFCAKTLTDSRSVNAGYGPTCASNFGLEVQWASAADQALPGEKT